jgi:hypothetical protein
MFSVDMSIYKFNLTDKVFDNFKSFSNHVRSYSKKNGLNLNEILKQNYDFYCSADASICIHCGKQCQYNGYNKGYLNPCYRGECYKFFILSNLEYYKDNRLKLGYFDLYDNTHYKCALSKRYSDITNELINLNSDYFVSISCSVCNSLSIVSLFDKKIHIKTCSEECRYKQISLTRKKNTLESNFLVCGINNTREVNHYINEYKKYPITNIKDTQSSLSRKYKDYPELQIPNKNSKVYFSGEYNLFFYSTVVKNSLYVYLGNSDKNYLEYHIQNNLGKTTCPGCDVKLLFTDVFGSRLIQGKYCCSSCYWKSLVGGKKSKEAKKKQSDTMKDKILNGSFTPNITNSWCNSRTEVLIQGKISYVRSSWEAIFWALNDNLEYESVRIPYVTEVGKKRNYIVDFYDSVKNILYEIKPKSEKDKMSNIVKTEYAIEYCKCNNIDYVIIDDDYFKARLENLDKSFLLNSVSEETLDKFLRGIKMDTL